MSAERQEDTVKEPWKPGPDITGQPVREWGAPNPVAAPAGEAPTPYHCQCESCLFWLNKFNAQFGDWRGTFWEWIDHVVRARGDASPSPEFEQLQAKYELLNEFYSEGHLPEVQELERIIERDRTAICDGVNGLKKVIDGREWLGEGRGPYEWDDDHWHDEFKATALEIRQALEPLKKIARDLSNCPKTWEQIQKARAGDASPSVPIGNLWPVGTCGIHPGLLHAESPSCVRWKEFGTERAAPPAAEPPKEK